ncbi:hypothetical protein SRHO_G00282400 [Serrasalmus rhombeus]
MDYILSFTSSGARAVRDAISNRMWSATAPARDVHESRTGELQSAVRVSPQLHDSVASQRGQSLHPSSDENEACNCTGICKSAP